MNKTLINKRIPKKVVSPKMPKSEVITTENIRRKGEYTAIRAVQVKLGYEPTPFMRQTYYNLIRDMDYFDYSGYSLTSSYEIAQEAVLFLCEHIGKRLTDIVIDGKGEPVTILKACFRHVNAYLSRISRKAQKDIYIEDFHNDYFKVIWDTEAEDYAVVNEKIAAMKLTERQAEVLQYRMDGRSLKEIACYQQGQEGRCACGLAF